MALTYHAILDIVKDLSIPDILALQFSRVEMCWALKEPNFWSDLLKRTTSLVLEGATFEEYWLISQAKDKVREFLVYLCNKEKEAAKAGAEKQYYIVNPFAFKYGCDKIYLNGLVIVSSSPEGALLKLYQEGIRAEEDLLEVWFRDDEDTYESIVREMVDPPMDQGEYGNGFEYMVLLPIQKPRIV
jgi:hypothetical protein